MRKWIIATAVIAGLAGATLGSIAGTYFGFHVAYSYQTISLADRAIANTNMHAGYFEMVRGDRTEELESMARSWMLVEAHAITIYFDYLDEREQSKARRLFRRVLQTIEPQDVDEGKQWMIDRLREHAGSEAGAPQSG